MKIDLNDPKLTAFALGELTGQEAEEMKNLIEKDPEAQKYVADVKRTAAELESQFAQEPLPRLEPVERDEIYQQTSDILAKKPAGWRIWALSFGGIAAAIVVILSVQPYVGKIMQGTAKQMAPEHVAMNAAPPAQTTVPAEPSTVAQNAPQGSGGVGGLSAKRKSQLGQPYRFKQGDAEGAADAAATSEMALDEEADVSTFQAPAAPPAASGKIEFEKQAIPGAPQPEMMYLRQANKKGGSGSVSMGFAGRGGIAAPSDKLEAKKEFNTESYSYISENGFKHVSNDPLSTFSIDVDTASYANMRRFLVGGQLPPADAVRIEELVNYFKYDYATPTDGKPFAVNTELTKAPWDQSHQLLRIGLKGRETPIAERPASNLVFLIDVSGSMDEANKLPLVQRSLKLLVDQMRAKDHVALVVYAGNSGLVLPSTSGEKKAEIAKAIDNLHAGGSTNGASGIELAYETAKKGFIKGGINRVILATDGDFNVGTTSEGELTRLIEEKAKSGVFLSVLGFGMGNYKDSTMQKLADKGNGNHAYIDSLREANKTLVEQAGGTLNTIAKDVKIQIEFNPARVAAYRLIGYEKRLLNKEDFNDDKKDAGEIGEGHTVTALYELVPPGVPFEKGGSVDALKYQKVDAAQSPKASAQGELVTVKLRFKKPDGDKSELMEVPVAGVPSEFEKATTDMKFAASVAGFGMVLRGSAHKGDWTLQNVLDTASKNATFKGSADEYRTEFVELVKQAQSLQKK